MRRVWGGGGGAAGRYSGWNYGDPVAVALKFGGLRCGGTAVELVLGYSSFASTDAVNYDWEDVVDCVDVDSWGVDRINSDSRKVSDADSDSKHDEDASSVVDYG